MAAFNLFDLINFAKDQHGIDFHTLNSEGCRCPLWFVHDEAILISIVGAYCQKTLTVQQAAEYFKGLFDSLVHYITPRRCSREVQKIIQLIQESNKTTFECCKSVISKPQVKDTKKDASQHAAKPTKPKEEVVSDKK